MMSAAKLFGWAALIGFSSLGGVSIAAQASPFALDLDAAAAGSPLVLTRPDKGIVEIGVLYSGNADTRAQIQTSQFSSDRGSVAAEILSDCGSPASKQAQPVTVSLASNAATRICLHVGPLPTGAKYTGRLIISAEGSAPMIRELSFTLPTVAQGTLVLDHATLSQTVSRSWWPFGNEEGARAEGSVALREKSNSITLEGVQVRLEQVTASPESGFDLRNNVRFELNGQEDNLDQRPTRRSRSRSAPPTRPSTSHSCLGTR